MPKLQQITILGATGTIGASTLNVISQHPNRFATYALTANNNDAALYKLCIEYKPAYAVLLDEAAAERLRLQLKAVGSSTEVMCGMSALEYVSSQPEVDAVMAAIVGAAGLIPAIASAKAGKRILLANKETLVMAGNLFMQAVKQGGATLLPIDSEHNAIFQVMPARVDGNLIDSGIKKILLTASGGPFRKFSQSELEEVSLEQALNHPNWVMGPKITIDSATLMNKGLEVIEARWLFNAKPSEIEVVVHPQSVIHSMVEYVDGSVLAQLGNPDMRTPIAYALGYPERLQSGVGSLDLFKIGQLDFEAPDTNKFPCLRLAYEALKLGGNAAAILNAANEIAVEAFIQKTIKFTEIPRLIEFVLNKSSIKEVSDLNMLIDTDASARDSAREWLSRA
ncbi:MAG: 1-deoxy-D-xylulose 5-phosphate reductoisomerase [Pseudomonadota bacterium]